MARNIRHNILWSITTFGMLTAAATYTAAAGHWQWLIPVAVAWAASAASLVRQYNRNAQKVALMLEAIENNDYSFQFSSRENYPYDKLVNESLNHISRMLFRAKVEVAQKEKYYELIINSVNTGIIVVNDNGTIFQTNNEALRLLGLTVFTHVKQLSRIDDRLQSLIADILPGDKHHISFTNERGTVNLSIRVSEMTMQDKHVRILAINDINSELDEKEIDSWISLTRVLTHEIMNSITPITSLSDTLLAMHQDADSQIRNGLETISNTGKGLISFVESYRRFTHIPTPEPSLFYVNKFIRGIIDLAALDSTYPNITVTTDITPDDLIIHADEKLIYQVVINLVKNATQAIGRHQPDGRIAIKAFCDTDQSVVIEVSNNGPMIPPEEADHIFVPFFTTKKGGSGIGLSISRQIMRLSGGSITMKSNPATGMTTFVLTFP